ncbi:MAG: transcriptional repressor [Deltaproteobacteria bacterium]|uniref:Transcriptional repressor n=1 Tax=Candidatus Zymogenus saltonus TaxID=2844893 RepID=A0A9D8KHZ9_9DELT|nr:transcriptional repressor [Candidatus Zymogenus saltonus]
MKNIGEKEITSSDPAVILRNSGLKRTLGRIKILEVLIKSVRPLTGKELLDKMGDDAVDPASVYRTLNALFEREVVHKIEGSDNIYHFAINRGEGAHPHFTCRTCGRMECLKMTAFPRIDIDLEQEGYLVERENLFIVGLCPACSIKE